MPFASESGVPSVNTLPERGISSDVKFVLFVATGAVLFGLTKIDKIAISVNAPSLMVYVIAGTVPVKVLEGINVKTPFAAILIVPISVILMVPAPAVWVKVVPLIA